MAVALLTISAPLRSQTTTELISVSMSGSVGNGDSEGTSMSGDGRWVVFDSTSSDLVPSDVNGWRDIFVRDRWTATTTCLSRTASGALANGPSELPAISDSSPRVVFVSWATNLVAGDTNARRDVFYCDIGSPAMHRASLSTAGTQANQHCQNVAVSGDGRFIAFDTTASTLVPNDTNGVLDVFVHDSLSGTTICASVDWLGNPGNGASQWGALSSDGRWIVFDSLATNLVAGDTNGVRDVFVRDLQMGTTARISVTDSGAEGNGASAAGRFSGDGRFLAFESLASNLVPNDSNGVSDVFVKNLLTGELRLVSVSTSGMEGNGYSGGAILGSIASNSVSFDGRFVAFSSVATNLQAGDDINIDIFVHDQLLHTTERVSLAPNGQELGGSVVLPELSADAREIAMMTTDPAAFPGDPSLWMDVFVRVRDPAPPASYCDGAGVIQPCPCGNNGLQAHGCDNSAATGGAWLASGGSASLSADTLSIVSSGERVSSLTLFLQGSEPSTPTPWGGGLRCIGGTIRRLYSTIAGGGAASIPPPGHASISLRSFASGDAIEVGATRYYQAYYRDTASGFCPGGAHANASNGLAVVWGP